MVAAAVAVVLGATACAPDDAVPSVAPVPGAADCPMLPADNVWNTPVTDLPIHARSDDWIASIGADSHLFADFGSGTYDGAPIGIPYAVVDGDQERVPVSFLYDDESDHPDGGWPIPPDVPIEGGPDGDGDRHVLLVDRDDCTLYELFDAHPRDDGGWDAGSGAVFGLRSNDLRPDTWTSADTAGLPILPGLVRRDEVAAGGIDHAIRFTAPRTDASYLWPARHQAGTDDPSLPPMGARLRLMSSFDTSGFPADVRVILDALQTYGMILADNGSPWFLSGVPDEGWDNDLLRALHDVPGSAFEVVDASGLQADRDSGRVATGMAADVRLAGPDRIATAIRVSRRGLVALSDEVDRAARAITADVVRHAGADRFDTAVRMTVAAEAIWDSPFTDVVVVLGAHADPSRAWPDALAAGVWAGRRSTGMVLIAPDAVPAATADFLARFRPDRATIVGGSVADPTARCC